MKAPVAAALVFACVACGGHRTSLEPFVGTWIGHTRQLAVRADGTGSEMISDGCCAPVVALRFKVVEVHRDLIRIRVTSVRLYDATAKPRPFVGERGTLTRRHGVFTESLTGSTFCAPGVNACGA